MLFYKQYQVKPSAQHLIYPFSYIFLHFNTMYTIALTLISFLFLHYLIPHPKSFILIAYDKPLDD